MAETDVKRLLERASIKAGMLRMGEPVAFGSDAEMIEELAEALVDLSNDNDRFIEGQVLMQKEIKALRAALSGTREAGEPLQARVQPWMMACFGPEISADKLERSDRFVEEALELVQSVGYSRDRVLALVDYVFGREPGDPFQEVGGVEITLAAFCLAYGMDMHEAGEAELARIWTKIDKIRAKQAAKPTGSALPAAAPPAPVERGAVTDETVRLACPQCDFGIGLHELERGQLSAALASPAPAPCTCHPDDNPPRPCPQKYALSECRAAAPQPAVEAQGPVTLARFTPTPSGRMMWDKYGEWVDRSDCMRALASEKARADRAEVERDEAKRQSKSHWNDLQLVWEGILGKRPLCRDCADEDGTCPNSGLPCDPTEAAVAQALIWKNHSEAAEAELAKLRQAGARIMPYLRYTIGEESPGYHPTMPSAVAALDAALRPTTSENGGTGE